MPASSERSSLPESSHLKSSESIGAAIDLGTTTIAASLVNIGSGERIAHASSLNPQREFGADVILRLQAACESEENLRRMGQLVNGEVERLVEDLLSRAGVDSHSLSTIAAAGNPAMEHLLLGLPVGSLVHPPHRPLFRDLRYVEATQLGWKMDKRLCLFPLPSGFVGGDLVGFLYSVLDTAPSSSLFVDVGTNAEIALAAKGKITATSAAAGPAFEGGNLSCGMAALPGAIERVAVSREGVTFSVIGNAPPAGICGSGVIDVISGLVEAGIIDSTGRLLPAMEIGTNLGNRITAINGDPAFVIYRDAARQVFLTQKDIRDVQSAKAAMRAGIEVLFSHAGISADDLDRVVLTGSFASRLSVEGLKSIGILTSKMVHNTDFIHGGVVAGVEKALTRPHGFDEVKTLAERIRVIPLSGTPVFQKLFIQHMNFPKR